MPRPAFTLSAGAHRIELGETTRIMGIVNVTPDSFSDGGRFFSADDAVAQAMRLVREGADIIDVGGESTRPFSDFVSEEEETRRVVPVIRALAERIDVPISIDTNKAGVARAAIEAGATILNDVGALRLDPLMAEVAAEFRVPVIVMHMLGTPKTMQKAPVYEDLFGEIHDFLAEAVGRALDAGVSRSQIVIDPGIGFGKTVTHNLMLLGDLSKLRELEAPILIGPSRKAFIRKLLKPPDQTDISTDLPIVETGTQAAVAAAVLAGAHILRVHDVAQTAATVRIVDAVRNALESEQDKIRISNLESRNKFE
ncbi:MAG: dihydropteroate synthase [Desulfobacterales bacterium]|nr:dihydropteroate synthase [Desulfobacterales bacterium]